ncbi:hypothetical protein BKA81DRAFT_42111 [Phyllosticta paracitricarpa]
MLTDKSQNLTADTRHRTSAGRQSTAAAAAIASFLTTHHSEREPNGHCCATACVTATPHVPQRSVCSRSRVDLIPHTQPERGTPRVGLLLSSTNASPSFYPSNRHHHHHQGKTPSLPLCVIVSSYADVMPPVNSPASQSVPQINQPTNRLPCVISNTSFASYDDRQHRISFFCFTNQWAGRSAAAQLPI